MSLVALTSLLQAAGVQTRPSTIPAGPWVLPSDRGRAPADTRDVPVIVQVATP